MVIGRCQKIRDHQMGAFFFAYSVLTDLVCQVEGGSRLVESDVSEIALVLRVACCSLNTVRRDVNVRVNERE